MKLKILLTTIFFASATLSFAFSSFTGITYSKSDIVKNSLEQLIVFPNEAIEMDMNGIVVVDFTLMPNGKARINAINYSDKEFKEQVIKKLNKLSKDADDEIIGKSFIYRFVFILK
jgi:hypothetical protein